ncbi:tetratricopeptide repeat protein, partial [Kitasatospora sp. NPDC057512]|uniref:tetratricopeptide repeat protein n=1 Tax=Kitasatospora sp. NPDC057512 TaxID=3346154 RepID=UPI0036A4ACF0
AFQEAGRTEDATHLLEQVVADQERVLGTDHPNTLDTRYGLATCYWLSGSQDHAVEMLRLVVPDFERVLGPDHPSTSAVREALLFASREPRSEATRDSTPPHP